MREHSPVEFLAGTAESAKRLRAGTVIAVDLGFAGAKNKSCGLAWKGKSSAGSVNQNFATTISKVVCICSDVTEAALIIEAPLSCFFDWEGNPVGRSFEKQEGQTHRYWYLQAGAVICLAALLFLRKLEEEMVTARHKLKEEMVTGRTERLTVHVFEGFVSFKTQRTSHSLDAERLRDGFLEGRITTVQKERAGVMFSVLRLAGCNENDELPAIVGLTNNAVTSF